MPFPIPKRGGRNVLNLSLEISQSISMRPDFSRYAHLDTGNTSILLRRYEIDSMGELGNTKKKRDRDFVTDDLRRNQDINYAHYKMLLGISDSFPPASRNRGGANFLEEISIRQNLLKYKIDFRRLTALLALVEILRMQFPNSYRLLLRMHYPSGVIFISI